MIYERVLNESRARFIRYWSGERYYKLIYALRKREMLTKAFSSYKSSMVASLYFKQSVRAFGCAPKECLDNLKSLGLKNPNVVYNPT
jgi:hypothetical protein